jgi:hypothetical protein
MLGKWVNLPKIKAQHPWQSKRELPAASAFQSGNPLEKNTAIAKTTNVS